MCSGTTCARKTSIPAIIDAAIIILPQAFMVGLIISERKHEKKVPSEIGAVLVLYDLLKPDNLEVIAKHPEAPSAGAAFIGLTSIMTIIDAA